MARGLFACFTRRSSSSASTIDVSKSQETSTGEPLPEELKTGGPVVVELFSSQGCATSPEAELLFSRLGRGDFNLEIPVVLLAYHVDYWDFNGWKDPFGSSQWSVRQKEYVESLNLDTMFTPQVVIQGRSHCIGNDEDALLSSIAVAPRYPSPAFQATFQRPTPESLQLTLKGSLRAKLDGQGADVMVALYESGLVTDCKNGDNKGRIIANDFVVRKLSKIWSLKNYSPNKSLTGTIDFGLWEGFNSTKCGIVVFVQQHSARHHVFGSQRIQLPADL